MGIYDESDSTEKIKNDIQFDDHAPGEVKQAAFQELYRRGYVLERWDGDKPIFRKES